MKSEARRLTTMKHMPIGKLTAKPLTEICPNLE
jgi:hypothetical protein